MARTGFESEQSCDGRNLPLAEQQGHDGWRERVVVVVVRR